MKVLIYCAIATIRRNESWKPKVTKLPSKAKEFEDVAMVQTTPYPYLAVVVLPGESVDERQWIFEATNQPVEYPPASAHSHRDTAA